MKMKTSSYRLQYLDWVRGFGALIMLQGHVFDSFLKNDYRPGGAYLLSQFVGGMPPAIFLFLTGVTLAFLMDSTERKGLPAVRTCSRLPCGAPDICLFWHSRSACSSGCSAGRHRRGRTCFAWTF